MILVSFNQEKRREKKTQKKRLKGFDEIEIPVVDSTAGICPGESLTQHDQQTIQDNPIS
jgi:hypothetical protein